MNDWSPPHKPARGDYIATLLILSSAEGPRGEWEGRRPSTSLRSEVAAFARQMSQEFSDQDMPVPGLVCHTYLRLKVRSCSSATKGTDDRRSAIDFEFGPSNAPDDIPRVPVEELFKYASEIA